MIRYDTINYGRAIESKEQRLEKKLRLYQSLLTNML